MRDWDDLMEHDEDEGNGELNEHDGELYSTCRLVGGVEHISFLRLIQRFYVI